MRLFAMICMVLAALSAPAFAQNSNDDNGGIAGISPGTAILGAAAIGLGAWGLSVALKKKDNSCASTC